MLLVAVSPLQIGSNVQILSETWFSFGLLVCLLALARLLQQAPDGILRQDRIRQRHSDRTHRTHSPRLAALDGTQFIDSSSCSEQMTFAKAILVRRSDL